MKHAPIKPEMKDCVKGMEHKPNDAALKDVLTKLSTVECVSGMEHR